MLDDVEASSRSPTPRHKPVRLGLVMLVPISELAVAQSGFVHRLIDFQLRRFRSAASENLHVVLPAECQQVGDTGHRPVFIHDLADHGGGFEPGQAGQIDSPFGLPGTNENAAGPGTQREDVAWPGQISRLGVVSNGCLNRTRPIGGADARSNTLGGIDADGEGCAETGRVLQRLRVQRQLVALLTRQR